LKSTLIYSTEHYSPIFKKKRKEKKKKAFTNEVTKTENTNNNLYNKEKTRNRKREEKFTGDVTYVYSWNYIPMVPLPSHLEDPSIPISAISSSSSIIAFLFRLAGGAAVTAFFVAEEGAEVVGLVAFIGEIFSIGFPFRLQIFSYNERAVE
jgi:hypothetical protein